MLIQKTTTFPCVIITFTIKLQLMGMEAVVERIKKYRILQGLSHENMAHELNISQAAYSKIEKMETKLSVERLLEIADILKHPLSDFFEEKSLYINVENNERAIGQVINLYEESKESYLKHIDTLKEEVAYLKQLLEKTL